MSQILNDPLEQFRFIQWHKSLGFVAFCLAVLRLVWRLLNPVSPEIPYDMALIFRYAAKWNHQLLYLFMFLLPVSGWLMASASPLQETFGIKNEVFGWFELFDPFNPGNEELAEAFSWIHFLSAISLMLLLAGHVGAALWHHIIRRDQVLVRMISEQIKK